MMCRLPSAVYSFQNEIVYSVTQYASIISSACPSVTFMSPVKMLKPQTILTTPPSWVTHGHRKCSIEHNDIILVFCIWPCTFRDIARYWSQRAIFHSTPSCCGFSVWHGLASRAKHWSRSVLAWYEKSPFVISISLYLWKYRAIYKTLIWCHYVLSNHAISAWVTHEGPFSFKKCLRDRHLEKYGINHLRPN